MWSFCKYVAINVDCRIWTHWWLKWHGHKENSKRDHFRICRLPSRGRCGRGLISSWQPHWRIKDTPLAASSTSWDSQQPKGAPAFSVFWCWPSMFLTTPVRSDTVKEQTAHSAGWAAPSAGSGYIFVPQHLCLFPVSYLVMNTWCHTIYKRMKYCWWK